MELSFFTVSIVLTIIWGLAYIKLKNHLVTSKGYFFLLLLMALAGIVLPLNRYLDLGTSHDFRLEYIVTFALLLVSALYPWLRFDSWFKRVDSFYVNPNYLSLLKTSMSIMVLLAIYAIVYTLPYAIIGYTMGASDVRAFIMDDSILPKSPLTTVAVGVGFLAPIYIVCFFLTLITPALKKYTIPIGLASLTYLVTSAPAQARDGFIMIPLTYFFIYQIFKGMLDKSSKKKIKKMVMLIVPVGLAFMLVITIDRFYNGGYESLNPFESMIAGTWGYYYQQPYVFDQTLQHQVYFHGIAKRFPFLANILGLPPAAEHILDFKFEWMFGTMYASFYSATGWTSLIIASLFFMFSWAIVIKSHVRAGNVAGILIVFSLYMYFLMSGLFYLRLSAASITSTYLAIIGLSYFTNKVILVNYKKAT